MRYQRAIRAIILFAASAAYLSAAPGHRVCVFVPGVVSGSPIYEQLVAGAKRAVGEDKGASIKIVEAGFNQAEWLDKLSAIAASGDFDLIVSSNPAIPDLARQVSETFPAARFFVADGWLPGSPRIHTVLYNQFEQGYLVGYLGGLLCAKGFAGSAPAHKAGIVVAQRYPTLDRLIIPGFERGLKDADGSALLEIRVIGNWYDAAKAAELAGGLFDGGAGILLPIAGGAGQGVLNAARSRGKPALWFDGDGYALAPGTVVGCAVLRQERLVYERVKAILAAGASSPLFGRADVVGVKEGYVDFDRSGASYTSLDPALRAKFETALSRLRSGSLAFPVSGL